MIKRETYSLEWISTVCRSNRNADPILVEKVIRAVTLLHSLAINELDFIFKGGTSLLLVFDNPKRLSIDIDIILNNRQVDLHSLFDKIVNETNFTRWEEQERKVSSKIEKAHYKFFYAPIHQTNKGEEYILLDILFESNHYPVLTEHTVQSSFLQWEGNTVSVVTPTAEGLLGDKLTAFAPNTTGIPYEKHGDSMSMEIIKQLYDIGNLFDRSHDMKIIRASFQSIAAVELQYRDHENKSIDDVYEDVIQTALTVSSRGVLGSGDYLQLQNGIKRVTRFIFGESFQIDKAVTAAAKAAYLSYSIKTGKPTIERYTDSAVLKDWRIKDPNFNKLNKLKKSNPEAFFYWYLMLTTS